MRKSEVIWMDPRRNPPELDDVSSTMLLRVSVKSDTGDSVGPLTAVGWFDGEGWHALAYFDELDTVEIADEEVIEYARMPE